MHLGHMDKIGDIVFSARIVGTFAIHNEGGRLQKEGITIYNQEGVHQVWNDKGSVQLQKLLNVPAIPFVCGFGMNLSYLYDILHCKGIDGLVNHSTSVHLQILIRSHNENSAISYNVLATMGYL
jgi:hypothetical protein